MPPSGGVFAFPGVIMKMKKPPKTLKAMKTHLKKMERMEKTLERKIKAKSKRK